MQMLEVTGVKFGHRVLIVEDDATFAQELAGMLGSSGMQTLQVSDLSDVDPAIDRFKPDLIVLDQFLGAQDALSHVGRLSVQHTTPIVMLTGNSDEVDRVIALEIGADDFISKLQRPREILARIRAVLRRACGPCPAAPDTRSVPDSPTSTAWKVKRSARRITTPTGTVLTLSSREYDCLIYLMDRTGKPVSRSELFEHVLRRAPRGPDDRSVDNMISQIRRRISPFLDDANPIQSSRNEGYVFVGFEFRDE